MVFWRQGPYYYRMMLTQMQKKKKEKNQGTQVKNIFLCKGNLEGLVYCIQPKHKRLYQCADEVLWWMKGGLSRLTSSNKNQPEHSNLLTCSLLTQHGVGCSEDVSVGTGRKVSFSPSKEKESQQDRIIDQWSEVRILVILICNCAY